MQHTGHREQIGTRHVRLGLCVLDFLRYSAVEWWPGVLQNMSFVGNASEEQAAVNGNHRRMNSELLDVRIGPSTT